MSYQDNMTLDDIHDYDNEMVDVAIKGAKKFNFREMQPCVKFMGIAMDATMKYLGIELPGESSDSKMDKSLRAMSIDGIFNREEIRIERRRHYRGHEKWRNGLYIYKKDVLVSYISEPMIDKPNLFVMDQHTSYSIVTNAKVDKYA